MWVLTKNRKILINLNALTDVYLTERGEDAEVAIDLPCGETIIIASGKAEEKKPPKSWSKSCSALERGDALCRLG